MFPVANDPRREETGVAFLVFKTKYPRPPVDVQLRSSVVTTVTEAIERCEKIFEATKVM